MKNDTTHDINFSALQIGALFKSGVGNNYNEYIKIGKNNACKVKNKEIYPFLANEEVINLYKVEDVNEFMKKITKG